MSERTFPVQRSYNKDVEPHPNRIPWSVADKAYSVYRARYPGSAADQSLERLAQRGGFAPEEMDMFVPEWRAECSHIAELEAEVAELKHDIARHIKIVSDTEALNAELTNICSELAQLQNVFMAGIYKLNPQHFEKAKKMFDALAKTQP